LNNGERAVCLGINQGFHSKERQKIFWNFSSSAVLHWTPISHRDKSVNALLVNDIALDVQ
jgi:hypothetical protein